MALRFDQGRAYAAQGDKTRARAAWDAVVAVDPDFCDVREHIADLDREPAPGDDESEGEAFESFDDLMSESVADGAEPKKGAEAKGEKFESFEDFMGGDAESDDDDPEDETQAAQISAAEAAEPVEAEPEPEPAPAPAPAASEKRPPPEPPTPKRKKKISFV
jgi:hypothetical protein